MKATDEFDILFSIWILSCIDENPIMTYEGIKHRLGLSDNFDVKKTVRSRGELFRAGVPSYWFDEWKRDLLAGKKTPPAWLLSIKNYSERRAKIESLSPEDAFRCQLRTGKGADPASIEVIDWGLQHIERLRKSNLETEEATSKWKSALIAAVLSIITTLIITYLAGQWSLNNQLKINNLQKQQQAFAELKGRAFMAAQLNLSRIQDVIESNYSAAKWRLAGSPKESRDYDEAIRWKKMSEDLTLEAAKSQQSLFETLALIRILFRNTPELQRLMTRVYRFEPPQEFSSASDIKNMAELEEWKRASSLEIEQKLANELVSPLDDLWNYLGREVTPD